MGFNTTLIIRNDYLVDIERDMGFGAKVAAAVRKVGSGQTGSVDVHARFAANAATVIETHHADVTTIVAVGGNSAILITDSLIDHASLDDQRRLLEDALAQVKEKIAAFTDSNN